MIAIGLLAVISASSYVYNTYELPTIAQINHELNLSPSAAGNTTIKPFKQFDGTQFKEPHAWLGDKITIVYEPMLLGSDNNYNKAPVESEVKQRLSYYRGQERLILVAQSWSVLTDNKIDPLAEQHAQWHQLVLTWAKETLPGTNIGFYGLPFKAIDAIQNQDSLEIYNKALIFMIPVMNASDSLYPAFDLGIDDPKLIEATMTKALIDGKPTYPVMWHRGSNGALLNKILPDSIIELQCKILRDHADGLVWWSGSGEKWDGGSWYPAANGCFIN